MRFGLGKLFGVRFLRGVGVQRTGMKGWMQKSTYTQPSSSMSDPYDLELKEQLGSNTIEYFKASSVLGKLTSKAFAKTEAAVAKTMEAVAETKEAVAKTEAAVAETKEAVAKTEAAVAKTEAAVAKTEAAVAKETEARIKVIELTRDLFDANTETLRLKGMLDVRGMLEEVERLISPGISRNPKVKRADLWNAALRASQNKALADVLIACFPAQDGQDAKKTAAVSTIQTIYRKASRKIHSHIDSNNVAIVVHLRHFREHEVDVIRALAKHHKFKLVEEK